MKPSNENEPRESPWGKGRLGWHLECLKMLKSFRNEFDIQVVV